MSSAAPDFLTEVHLPLLGGNVLVASGHLRLGSTPRTLDAVARVLARVVVDPGLSRREWRGIVGDLPAADIERVFEAAA